MDYKIPQEDMIKEIVAKTGGKLSKVLDAAGQNVTTAAPLFKQLSSENKMFTSTDDW